MATKTHNADSSPQVSGDQKPYLIVHQFLDLGLFLIQGILLLSFLLKMAGANRGAGFVQLVLGLSNGLMAPFRYIFPAAQAGQYVFDWSILVAMLVYGLIVVGIRQIIAVIYTADQA